MADDRTIRVRLLAEIGSYMDGMRRAGAATRDFAKNVSGHGTAVKADIEKVSRAALIMSGGIAVALGASVKAAIDWESAWAGVTKTVDGSASEMAVLHDELRGLASELPATHKQIAAVAEAAGQLGIQRESVAGFTRVMIDLGETTNLTADEAATSIAQMVNIMGTSQGDVDRLGAALVELGNNGASTERDILEMSLRLAGAGKLIGASESDVLALANAMASLGIEAQLGGGAMSRTMQRIYTAVKSGGDILEGFAKVAGTSAEEFARKFQDEPILAVDAFIQGLSRIEGEGGNVIATLDELKIRGTQDLSVLLRLKGAGDLLSESVKMGSAAWLENVALQEEAAKRYETTASQLGVLRNQIVDVAIDTGGVFLPALKGATSLIGEMVSGFGELDGAGRTALMSVLGLTGGVTGLIGAIGFIGPRVKEFRDALGKMGTIGKFSAANLGLISAGLFTVTGLLAAYTIHLGKNAKQAQLAAQRAAEYGEAIETQGDAIGAATDEITLYALVAGDVGKELRDTGMDLSVFTDAVNQTGTAAEDMQDGLRAISDEARRIDLGDVALGEFRDRLNDTTLAGTALGDTLIALAESDDLSGDALGQLIDRLAEQSESLQTARSDSLSKAAADEEAAESARNAVPGTKAFEKALEDQAKAAEKARDELEELIDAQRAQVDPLFAMLDALHANTDARAELNEALANGQTPLEELDRLHQNAAESALDLEAAAIALAGEIKIGGVNLDLAAQMLRNWVREGLVTEETARRMAQLFGFAYDQADLLGSEFLTTLTLEDNVSTELDDRITYIQSRLDSLGLHHDPLTYFRPPGAEGPYLVLPPENDLVNTSASGGPVHLARGGLGWPWSVSGTDTVPAMLTPGEFVLRRAAVERYGLGLLYGMNALRFADGGAVVRHDEVSPTTWDMLLKLGWHGGVDVISPPGGEWAGPGTVYEDGAVRGGDPIPGSDAWWADHPGYAGETPTDWDAWGGPGASEANRAETADPSGPESLPFQGPRPEGSAGTWFSGPKPQPWNDGLAGTSGETHYHMHVVQQHGEDPVAAGWRAMRYHQAVERQMANK